VNLSAQLGFERSGSGAKKNCNKNLLNGQESRTERKNKGWKNRSRAAEGDVPAAAQLRGWHYADQRNQRRLDSTLEANAMHLGPATDEEKTDWSEFIEQRLASQQKQQALACATASAF
jgi:hypothetical protein